MHFIITKAINLSSMVSALMNQHEHYPKITHSNDDSFYS